MAVDLEQHIAMTNLRRYLELRLRMASARRFIEESERQIKEDTEEVARIAENLATNIAELMPDVAKRLQPLPSKESSSP